MSGRFRLRHAEITVMVVVWVGVLGVMEALAGARVSPVIVYGWYPVAVPLIVAGLAWAGIMAARANWRSCVTALAVAVGGVVALVAGPVGAWAVAGVGLCRALLDSAAAVALLHRA